MNEIDSIRTNSLDKFNLNNWRWQRFFDQTLILLSKYKLQEYPIPQSCLERNSTLESSKNNFSAHTVTWACSTTKIRQARAACLEASSGISVLNFLISPLSDFNLPFFGADFVTLPSGHLLALDLQPVLKNDKSHTEDVWDQLIPLHQKWQALLPDGGLIPKEAKNFFSPGFLWTRLPLGIEGDQLIEDVIFPAYSEYFYLYITLLDKAEKVSLEKRNKLFTGQRMYMNYRARKDPARGLLARFYGKEWTEFYIHNALFDLESRPL